MTQDSPKTDAPRPWWRERMMWLVVGGPAAVVVAATITAVIAIRGGDVPLSTTQAADDDGQAPALQARNHAAAPRR